MKIRNGREYLESLRKVGPRIYYKGKRINDVTKHPATAPHARAAAMTYALACEAEYRDLATPRYINFLWPYPEDIDPERPLYSYAKGFLRGMNWSTAEEGEKQIAGFIAKYSIDGIFTLNARTRRAAGAFQDVNKEMDRRFGVPGVIIDADQIDAKFFFEA